MNPFNNNNTAANNPFASNNNRGNTTGFNNFNNQNQQGGSAQGWNSQSNNNQQQGGGFNMLNNQQQNQNQQQGAMFNNNNQGNNLSNNQGNNQGSGGMFNNNNQGSGGMFNNNNQGSGGMFNNNNNQQQQQQGSGSMFNNTQQGGGMFNNNNNTQQQGGGMFNNNNNTQQGGGMFSNNNQQGNTQGMFANKPNQFQTGSGSNNNIGTSQPGSHSAQSLVQYHQHIDSVKHQLEDCLRRLNLKNYELARIDPNNIYKDQPMNKLPITQQCVQVIYTFQELKKSVDQLKSQQTKIEKKSEGFSKNMHQKLSLYKKCLLQTTTHKKMVDEISSEIDMMVREIDQFFKPLFMSYQKNSMIPLKQPNNFDLKISYSVLQKLQALGQRVDDLITCQQQTPEQQINSTINVFEQLVQYYENVSCNFKDFKNAYDNIKRQVIERERKEKYETIMGKVHRRSKQNLKKQYYYYDLIKQIDVVLAKRDQRTELKKREDYSKARSYGLSL